MSTTSLPTLLAQLSSLHRQHSQLEHEIAAVEKKIVEASASRAAAPKSKSRRKRSTNAELAEFVRATVKVLRDADEALPCSEIASRLGIAPSAVTYRLKKAIKANFVEKIGSRYRCTDCVPAFKS